MLLPSLCHGMIPDINCPQRTKWEVWLSLEIVSLLGICPPSPGLSPFFLTLHISERTEWASLFIGPLNDLLKGSAMNGWRGWGGYERQGGGCDSGSGCGLCACPVCSHSGLCHTSRRQGGRVLPPYQHATAAPGSCISHAWPSSLSSLPLFTPGRSSIWRLERAGAAHRVQ